MTGSTEFGPIQAQQDSSPLLDEGLFADGPLASGLGRHHCSASHLRRRSGAKHPERGKMTTTTTASTTMTPSGGGGQQPVQLTPLWEYVVRTKKFPRDSDPGAIFAEISGRLRDPEWEVRQHALRVLVDVLPTLGPEAIDALACPVLPELVRNLGNPAPAVRKGSLDALRIYLLHTPRRDEFTTKILREGINRADLPDDRETRIARGVILSAPLLLFPSRSSTRPSAEVVREATQALALRLVQVSHQESALRSLAKIREAVGEEEFAAYLAEIDDSMARNFELLCDVYGLRGTSGSGSGGRRSRQRPTSNDPTKHRSAEGNRPGREAPPVAILAAAADKGWDSEDDEDSDTSGIAEEDGEAARSSSGGAGRASDRVVLLETEIKFDQETAITMTILEEREREEQSGPGRSVEEGLVAKEEEEEEEEEKDEGALDSQGVDEGTTGESAPVEERRKTPRRVHFGGEIVKLRTPDSEDAESVLSDAQMPPSPAPRTRIPLPVAPATRLPTEQPRRRARSSSHPRGSAARRPVARQRRSASSSPRRRDGGYTHDPGLSPKKGILRPFDVQEHTSRTRLSRRDSVTPTTSPRIIIDEVPDSPRIKHESFLVCEEPEIGPSSRADSDVPASGGGSDAWATGPNLLGDACEASEIDATEIESIFGDRSGIDFQQKMEKNQANAMRSANRSRSALENGSRNEWADERDASGQGKDGRRSQSAKIPGFEVFPRQERNYILMELSSAVKDMSRRASLEDNLLGDIIVDDSAKSAPYNEYILGEQVDSRESARVEGEIIGAENEMVDSNKMAVDGPSTEHEKSLAKRNGEEDTRETRAVVPEEEPEKSALDAKERSSSDSGSDGEWKYKEASWEELGLVDDEVLDDVHNKEDWRARVRGLERVASALKSSLALEAVEPRLGSLLHAVLGGERSCRVAAAGMGVAKVVLAGVNEEALKDRLSLVAWGLARQGGPNAAHLARMTMLRTSPGLFLVKLLQPQCVGARNAKMRENTLQLLIFSLVTFPSTEFKVKSAIEKVVAMVADPRKRVRHASLDALAVLAQIYESEDILEASKSFTKGRQDGQLIQEAIKTRLSRKLLPTVSVDGLVVYGLQMSSNNQHSGPDVDWILNGSGSVSSGTGRTRGQLIAMSKLESAINEQENPTRKSKNRPVSEHGILHGTIGGTLKKDERTSSWKLLPQSDQNNRLNQEVRSRKTDRTSRSADLFNKEFKIRKEEVLADQGKIQKPYATPKRYDRAYEREISNDRTAQNFGASEVQSSKIARPESRIPVYTGDRAAGARGVPAGMSNHERAPVDSMSRKDFHRLEQSEINGYLDLHERRKLHMIKSAVPRTNHTINSAYANNLRRSQYQKSIDDADSDLQRKLIKDDFKNSLSRYSKENHQRALSYEKLNRSIDAVMKNSRAGLRSVPHYQHSPKVSETYESIYQRQRRFKEEKAARNCEISSGPVCYGHDYVNYQKSARAEREKSVNMGRLTDVQSVQKRQMFFSPFDDRAAEKPIELLDKEAGDHRETDSQRTTASSAGSKSLGRGDRVPSPAYDVAEARSSSCSISSSRSSGRGLTAAGPAPPPTATTTSRRQGSEESGERARGRSRPVTPGAAAGRAFDVISTGSGPVGGTPEDVSLRTDPEDESPTIRREPAPAAAAADPSSEPGRRSAATRLSLESLMLMSARDDDPAPQGKSPRSCSRSPRGPPRAASSSSQPTSRSGSSERAYSARADSVPATSMVNLNGFDDCLDARNFTESSDGDNEEADFDTLDFRNSARGASSAASVRLIVTPVRSRASFEYDDDLRNSESNITLYSCNSATQSPKSAASPKRFAAEDPGAKDTDSEDTPPPLPIGFDGVDRAESCSDDCISDETDDVGVKPQPSRLPTPVDLLRRMGKVSPCKMKSHTNCHRIATVPSTRHHEKHSDKSSKAMQQCFTQLESKDWEVTLKGLRTLSQITRDDPEQLDICTPGLLARILGKHVKNLRSQVARVACSAAAGIFSAHVRGIDQDLDEIAGPLLHRTADTNRFLREDCNTALNSMVEHFPPHRTILTIANRGAGHQNTIVHATTARLLHLIATEIGPEHLMLLPREVRDTFFATTAKLLTDGNLQARKHAKETFKLLARCQGFQKALTDAVPETTLRLIDKTLRTL